MKESEKSVNELIDKIVQTNVFCPVEDSDSIGLSPDLSDGDIEGVIERYAKESDSAYEYYFDDENCVLYKSGYEGSLEEYIGDGMWNLADYESLIGTLRKVGDLEADEIIKEIEGDEYDLVDGYVLEDYSGEV